MSKVELVFCIIKMDGAVHTPCVLQILKAQSLRDVLYRQCVAEINLVGQEEKYGTTELLSTDRWLDDIIVELIKTLRIMTIDHEDNSIRTFVVMSEKRSLKTKPCEVTVDIPFKIMFTFSKKQTGIYSQSDRCFDLLFCLDSLCPML